MRKYCPVCGCHAGPQLRLASHIKHYHSNVPRATRLKLTKQAQVLQKRMTPSSRPKGTPTLEILFAKQVKEQSSQPQVAEFIQPLKSTCHFKSFAQDHPKFLLFKTFLRGLDGGRKMELKATQITADINKFLKFVHPDTDDPIWLDLLDAAKASAYLDYLEAIGACGTS